MADELDMRYANMYHNITSHVRTCLVGCCAKYRIVDKLLEKEMNSEELAVATNTREPNLKRLCLALQEIGVLKQSEHGTFSVTKFGETLKSSGDYKLSSYAKFQAFIAYAAVGNMLFSMETGGTGFEDIHGKSIFELIKEDGDKEDLFVEAMSDITNISNIFIAPAYDFSKFNRIVDVGGGNGTLVRLLLQQNLTATGVVFDIPTTVSKAQQSLKDEFGDRCSVVGGDFLASVPGDGDCYILKNIIHNWNDEKAITILRNVRNQMKNETKLLVIEPIYGDEFSFSLDLIMMTVYGGQTREMAHYERMFASVGLKINNRIKLPQFIEDIIEVSVV